MLALTTPALWYTSRASGIVSLILFSVVMALGLATSARIGGRTVPRFAVAELHRRLSLLAVVFLGIHIMSAVLDSYVHIGLVAVFVPFTSSYKPLDIALGTIALDLLLAVVITSLLRNRLAPATWRAIHWIAYLSWPVAVIHAILIGTDVQFGWMDLLLAGCVLLVAGSLVFRVLAHPRRGGARTAGPGPTPLNRRAATAPRGPARRSGQRPSPAPSTTPGAAQPSTARPVASSSAPRRTR